jgi:hypothetical protein
MLRGYFAPVWSYLSGKTNETNFYRLLNRIGTDPGNVARSILAENFDDFQHRFIDNLHELLPHVSEQDLYWRLHCLLGVLMYSTNNLDRLHRISGGRFDVRDGDAFFANVIPLLSSPRSCEHPASRQVSQTRHLATKLGRMPMGCGGAPLEVGGASAR